MTRPSPSSRRSRCARSGRPTAGTSWSSERDARQLTQPEKAARATYVVENDGTVQDLERQLSGVLDKLAA